MESGTEWLAAAFQKEQRTVLSVVARSWPIDWRVLVAALRTLFWRFKA